MVQPTLPLKLVAQPQARLPRAPGDTFACERLRAVLKGSSCVARQDARKSWGNHGQVPVHKVCQGCPQGAQVRASIDGGNLIGLPKPIAKPVAPEANKAVRYVQGQLDFDHDRELARLYAGIASASTPSFDLLGNVDPWQGLVAERIWAAELSGEPLDFRGLIPDATPPQEKPMQDTTTQELPLSKPACSVDGCGKPAEKKGKCGTHYKQEQRAQAGKPEVQAKPRKAKGRTKPTKAAPVVPVPVPAAARAPIRPEDLTPAELAACVAYGKKLLADAQLLAAAFGGAVGEAA